MGKVLLMLPNNPGDVLMATPAVRALKSAGEIVHFLVDSDSSEMAAHNPNIEKLFILPRRKIKTMLSGREWKKGVSELKEFIAPLQAEDYTRVVNLFQGPLTSIMAALIPCREFSGMRMHRNGKIELTGDLTALLYAIPYSRRYVPAHVSDFYTLMCKVKPDGKPSELFLTDRARAYARKLIRERGLNPEKLVVIHPCSAHLKKEWPHENVTELLNLLQAAGYQTVLTGSAREKERVAALIAASKDQDAPNLCGSANFLESAAIMGSAKVVVCGDTVAMHIATGLGVKCISIFAPTSPLETGPYAAGSTVFTSDCLCYGSYEGYCPVGKRCTGRITPQNVLDEIEGREPSLQPGCHRLVSAFDPQTGFIDYQENGKSGYLPSARGILQAYSGVKLVSGGKLTLRDKRTLDRLEGLLNSSQNCMSRIKGTRDKEKLKSLLAENDGIEHNINSLTGVAAYLSAVLRFQNNSLPAASVSEITSGLLKNGRELSVKIQALKNAVGADTEETKLPAIKVLIPAKNKEEITDAFKESFTKAVDYADLQIEGVDDRADSINKRVRESTAEYVLLLNRGIIPTAGFLDEMVSALNRDQDYSACLPKILYKDDTVHHAALEFNQKRDFTPILYRMQRFAPEVIQYREVLAAEMLCVLIKREVFAAVGGFEENYTPLYRFLDFCMKLRSAGRKMLFCPDAEVYFEPVEAKLPSAADLDRDQWKLFEKWKDLPALARPAEPQVPLPGINA